MILYCPRCNCGQPSRILDDIYKMDDGRYYRLGACRTCSHGHWVEILILVVPVPVFVTDSGVVV